MFIIQLVKILETNYPIFIGQYCLKILNHIGNTVYTQEKINSPSIEINIGNYAKGIYFLYITDNETIIFTEKLIIQ
jgi:predicted DNA-binding helix-hairpin-helix protein